MNHPVKSAWRAVLHTLGWGGIIFMMGSALIMFALPWQRHTTSFWDWGAPIIATVTLAVFVARECRDRRIRAQTIEDALNIVNRLADEGHSLRDASKEELETIRAALKS